jgi:CRP-like cAMP-binding protein
VNKLLINLFEGCKIKGIPKNTRLIYEGDEIKNIYNVVSGYIKVYTVVNSKAQRIIFIYQPGDVFPLTTYLSGSNIARFFYESMGSVQIRAISAKKFEKKIEGNHQLGEVLIKYTTAIDRQFLRRVNDMVADTNALHKVISLLNFLMEKFGHGKELVHVSLPLTLKDIANMCGLEREEIAKQLVYLKDKGVTYGVTYSSHSFVIDKAKLKELSLKT